MSRPLGGGGVCPKAKIFRDLKGETQYFLNSRRRRENFGAKYLPKWISFRKIVFGRCRYEKFSKGNPPRLKVVSPPHYVLHRLWGLYGAEKIFRVGDSILVDFLIKIDDFAFKILFFSRRRRVFHGTSKYDTLIEGKVLQIDQNRLQKLGPKTEFITYPPLV